MEHQLRYKKDLSPEILAGIEAELSECAELSALLDTKMQNIKDTIEKEG